MTFFWKRGVVARNAFEASRHGVRKLLRESGRRAEVGTVIVSPIRSMEVVRQDGVREEAPEDSGKREDSSSTDQYKLTLHTQRV